MLHDLQEKIRSGNPVLGTWLYLNDVGVAEIVAQSGFDFVIIDMEHSPTGFGDLRNLIMALERHTAPIVRVKANAPEFISAVLDLGPCGVMVPRVNTAEQARFAVECAKYAPVGQRGFGPFRVSEYTKNIKPYLEQANKKQLLWVQIEHRDAVASIDEIVQVEGVDLFFIGLSDLSQSLGHIGDAGHPEVVASARGALEAIVRAGVPAGSAFGSAQGLLEWKQCGMNVFTLGADFRFVLHGAKAFADGFAAEMAGA